MTRYRSRQQLVSVRDQTVSASARVPDTSKDSSRSVPALDDLSSFAYQSQRSARGSSSHWRSIQPYLRLR
uniref:Uncharacterized protein n=1 Tax=Brassica oleracea var. oleracea TaxID=109376 RepID=A0A0D3CES9_BRAOL